MKLTNDQLFQRLEWERNVYQGHENPDLLIIAVLEELIERRGKDPLQDKEGLNPRGPRYL